MLDKAILPDQRRKMEKSSASPAQSPERMRENLARVNEFVRAIVFNMNMDDVLQAACRTAREIVQADYSAIYLQHLGDSGVLHLMCDAQLPAAYRQARVLWGEDARRYEHGSYTVEDVALLPDDDSARRFAGVGDYRATAEIPMLSGSMLQGMLVVFHRQPYAYNKIELDFLETLAFQIMVAADNAGLMRMLEAYATEQAQLVHLSRISTASLELDAFIENVSGAMCKIMLVDRVYVGLLSPDLTMVQVFGTDSKAQMFAFDMDLSTLETPLHYADMEAMPEVFRQIALAYGEQSLAAGLLVTNTQPLGVIILGSPARFGTSECHQLEVAANQIAVQLHNVQRFHQVENALSRRLNQLALIEDVVRRMPGARTVDELIGNVMEAAINATGANMAALALIAAKPQDAFTVIIREWIGGRWVTEQTIRPRETGVMGRVARTGETVILARNDADPDYLPASSAIVYQSSLVVPLFREQAVIGVLNVESVEQDFFCAEDADLLNSLSGHAVISLENARLLQESQAQYEKFVESSNRIGAILDSSSDGIMLLDESGSLIQFNGSAETLLGINLDEYVGLNLATELLRRAPDEDNSEETREALRKMARILRLEPERITRHEYELKRRGQSVHIEEVGSPVFDSQHRVVGRLLVLRDMTEQHLLAQYRDEITNMAVHDLRGPLGAIINGLLLALDIIADPQGKPFEEELVPTLQASIDSGQNLLRLVDSLLDIAKMETRALPIEREPWSLATLVQEAYRALERSFVEAQITVEIRIPDDLPPVHVDEDKIRRVLINLLDNALRYAPHGGHVMVEAALLEQERRVLVRVADDGKGIPADQRDRVFEKFRQIKENAPERGRKGSGLGLTFSRLAIEAHDGHIWVEEKGPLPGACFAFTLPVFFENRNTS